CYHHNSGMWTF
nr:immunoglobulin light chain junction region [Macaca mulatta]